MARRTLIQQSRAISSKDKARFHEIDGAGKSHVTREFFGLNRQDEQAIETRINDGLDQALKE